MERKSERTVQKSMFVGIGIECLLICFFLDRMQEITCSAMTGYFAFHVTNNGTIFY